MGGDDVSTVIGERDVAEQADEVSGVRLPTEIQDRKDVLKVHRELDPRLVCEQFGLLEVVEIEGIWRILDILAEPYVELGRLVTTFVGSSIVATCRSGHRGCKLILTEKPNLGLDLISVRADLISWLAAGSVSSGEEHKKLAQWMKSNLYAMKVRSSTKHSDPNSDVCG